MKGMSERPILTSSTPPPHVLLLRSEISYSRFPPIEVFEESIYPHISIED